MLIMGEDESFFFFLAVKMTYSELLKLMTHPHPQQSAQSPKLHILENDF